MSIIFLFVFVTCVQTIFTRQVVHLNHDPFGPDLLQNDDHGVLFVDCSDPNAVFRSTLCHINKMLKFVVSDLIDKVKFVSNDGVSVEETTDPNLSFPTTVVAAKPTKLEIASPSPKIASRSITASPWFWSLLFCAIVFVACVVYICWTGVSKVKPLNSDIKLMTADVFKYENLIEDPPAYRKEDVIDKRSSISKKGCVNPIYTLSSGAK